MGGRCRPGGDGIAGLLSVGRAMSDVVVAPGDGRCCCRVDGLRPGGVVAGDGGQAGLDHGSGADRGSPLYYGIPPTGKLVIPSFPSSKASYREFPTSSESEYFPVTLFR